MHRPYIRKKPHAETGVLLIHGILSTPRHFDFLIPHIPDEYEICSILLAGHGGSVRDFSKATMKQWQSQVKKALNELETHCSRIFIIGHSLGALLTLNEVQQHQKVAGILLLNPPLLPRLQCTMIGRSLRFAFGKIQPGNMADALCYEDLSIRLEPYLWKYLGWIPNFASLLRLAAKCRKIPATLDIPCYAFLGMKDELVHPKTARHLKDNPIISLEILENGVHFGYLAEDQKRIIEKFHCLLDQAQQTK